MRMRNGPGQSLSGTEGQERHKHRGIELRSEGVADGMTRKEMKHREQISDEELAGGGGDCQESRWDFILGKCGEGREL